MLTCDLWLWLNHIGAHSSGLGLWCESDEC